MPSHDTEPLDLDDEADDELEGLGDDAGPAVKERRRRPAWREAGRSRPDRTSEPLAKQRLRVIQGWEDPEVRSELREHAATPRPRTRGDCRGGVRPCPWYGCKFHLGLDFNADSGTLTVRELEALEESCSLDVADRGGVVLEEVGRAMDLTRERVRQVETRAALRMRHGMVPIVLGEELPPRRPPIGPDPSRAVLPFRDLAEFRRSRLEGMRRRRMAKLAVLPPRKEG